ncbi:hypothetical protein KSX_07010 [Ktedonospora formicarum]|uniref:Uncharacterized protein n=1 Tax=Ktedonospora formicarum TaxID=2778364 RepID=A0A8J3MQF4_9CHLR|nr:hypothetical protein KSX_07010 [Ktedonospora formicarum]
MSFHCVVVIDDVTAPIDVHRAWNMFLLIFIAGSNIVRVLYLCAIRFFALNATDIATHVYNAEMGIAQMFRQPLSLYEKCLPLWF